MQGRGRDGKAHDLKTITKHKTRKAWFGEVGEAEVEAAAAEGLLLLCAREVVMKAPSRAADRQEGGGALRNGGSKKSDSLGAGFASVESGVARRLSAV